VHEEDGFIEGDGDRVRPRRAGGDIGPTAHGAPVLLRAERLGFAHPGRVVFAELSFELHAGLTLVRGGDGRGKTTLLALIAGLRLPGSGVLHRHAPTVFFADPADPVDESMVARDRLAALSPHFPDWDHAAQDALVEAFGLAPHIDKPLYMLSTGSRRKLALVAAFACGASVVLLDMPFAALDASSRALLAELLAEAAGRADRACVVADYELPDSLGAMTLAGVVDLGD
jgi:ABC-type transport system involved in cytochrome c biogenesis ATPase subunit